MPVLDFPGVGKDPFILRAEQRKPTVPEYVHRLAQGNQPAIIVENGIRVRQSRPGVDFPVVFVDGQPGGACCEAGVFTGGPLHGCTGVVPASGPDGFHHIPGIIPLGRALPVQIVNFQVLILLQLQADVGHAQLFALIDVGRTLETI